MPGKFWRRGDQQKYDRYLLTAWLIIVVFAATWLELSVAALGILTPLVVLLSFHIGVSVGPFVGFFAGLIGSAAVEASLGRTSTAVPVLILTALMAWKWRDHGERNFLPILVFPGGVLGGLYALYLLTTATSISAWPSLATSHVPILLTAGSAAIGAILLPIWCHCSDAMSTRLELPRFRADR